MYMPVYEVLTDGEIIYYILFIIKVEFNHSRQKSFVFVLVELKHPAPQRYLLNPTFLCIAIRLDEDNNHTTSETQSKNLKVSYDTKFALPMFTNINMCL